MINFFERRYFLTLLILFSLVFTQGEGLSQGNYPQQPITFYIHSRPGSAIDLTTRQLTRIAAKYTDVTLLVENKTGGSGLVAMQHVLGKKADGYSVLAMTKSFISTVLLSRTGIDLNDFQYLAAMVVDPEVLITNRHAPVHTFQQILDDAEKEKGKQKWLGPLVGGVDHLMALKTWDYLHIRGEWIPFEGGSDALASLLGQHGTVYVGNPVDIMGRPDLMIAVVAAPQRLKDFPEVPTFKELGYDIESEVLWRGYIAKKGIPEEAVTYLIRLFEKVGKDPEWIQFVRQSGAENVMITGDNFYKMVIGDQQQTRKYLIKAGLKVGAAHEKVISTTLNGIVNLFLLLFILVFIFFKKHDLFNSEVIIPLGLIFFASFLFIETLSFPPGKLGPSSGPAAMPRLWLVGLMIFSLWLLISKRPVNGNDQRDKQNSYKAMLLALMMGIYILATTILGFYLSTFIFILLGIFISSYKHYVLSVIFAGLFVLFSYLVFRVILMVPLPTGIFG